MSRPRFGVGVVSKGTKKKPSLTSRADASFVCEPADVLFTDWHPGSVYEAVVQAGSSCIIHVHVPCLHHIS